MMKLRPDTELKRTAAPLLRAFVAAVWVRVVRCVVTLALLAASFLLSGCTFAQYSKVRVQVVDQETRAGIYKAQLRTFYTKPMLDMSYQRKDSAKTDRGGFATLSVATNSSQWMVLGWTHGIFPRLDVQADGYLPQQIGIPRDNANRLQPVVIELKQAGAK